MFFSSDGFTCLVFYCDPSGIGLSETNLDEPVEIVRACVLVSNISVRILWPFVTIDHRIGRADNIKVESFQSER